jgi:hypothetical protein
MTVAIGFGDFHLHKLIADCTEVLAVTAVVPSAQNGHRFHQK